MQAELRKTGIKLVGDIPWGTHFCNFYETKDDLLDILIPYFKTGLENNEFCLWIVSEPLAEEEAKNSLRQAIPKADQYLTAGDIEILPHAQWYLKGGTFAPQWVNDSWLEKLNHALSRGYAGMRVNGIAAWLTKKDWKDFAEYEKELNKLIADQKMIVLCTYPLEKSGPNEIFDVARSHQFITAIRNGKPEILETPTLKQAKDEIKRLNKELEQRIKERTTELALKNEELKKVQELAHFGSWSWDIENNVVTWSDEVYRIFGITPQEFGSTFEAYFELVHPEDRDFIIKTAKNPFGKDEPFSYYYRIIRPDGEVRILYSHRNVFTDEHENLVRSYGTLQDVTERVQAEEQLKTSNEKLRALAARLQAVREEESLLIARKIHDELGSALTGLKMDISWLKKRLPGQGNESLRQKFKTMSELIDETVQKVRNISTELRPTILDDLGLVAAIESQCREFQKRTEIKCRIISLSEEIELHPDKATAVFRIFQEILTNIARHSGATQVKISMEEVDGDLVLKVSDNGKGIKEINIFDTKSLGILGMFERASVFGGQIEITGKEGKGTTLTVRIPRG